MNTSFLLTGSNMGDRESYLTTAIDLIGKYGGTVIESSQLYETAPWGKADQPPFLNQALKITTLLNARQLIRRILKIEKMMGRLRDEKYGPRLIDIDILFFNDEKHNTRFLKVPHPEMQNRRFALVPLAEIAADQYHPVLEKTVTQLLEECPDLLPVKKYN